MHKSQLNIYIYICLERKKKEKKENKRKEIYERFLIAFIQTMCKCDKKKKLVIENITKRDSYTIYIMTIKV